MNTVKEKRYSITLLKHSEVDFIQGEAVPIGVGTTAMDFYSEREKLGSILYTEWANGTYSQH